MHQSVVCDFFFGTSCKFVRQVQHDYLAMQQGMQARGQKNRTRSTRATRPPVVRVSHLHGEFEVRVPVPVVIMADEITKQACVLLLLTCSSRFQGRWLGKRQWPAQVPGERVEASQEYLSRFKKNIIRKLLYTE